jgi:hypothetical protein
MPFGGVLVEYELAENRGQSFKSEKRTARTRAGRIGV